MRRATTTADTTAIHHTGKPLVLLAGRSFEVADIDGADERGELWLKDPGNGELLRANPHDRNLMIVKEGFDRNDRVIVPSLAGWDDRVLTVLAISDNGRMAYVSAEPGTADGRWVAVDDLQMFSEK